MSMTEGNRQTKHDEIQVSIGKMEKELDCWRNLLDEIKGIKTKEGEGKEPQKVYGSQPLSGFLADTAARITVLREEFQKVREELRSILF